MSELDRMAQYMIDGQFSARSFNIRTGDTLTVDITRLNEAGKTNGNLGTGSLDKCIRY